MTMNRRLWENGFDFATAGGSLDDLKGMPIFSAFSSGYRFGIASTHRATNSKNSTKS